MASQYAEQKNKNEFAYKSSPPAKTSFQEFTSLVSSSGAKDNTAEMEKQNQAAKLKAEFRSKFLYLKKRKHPHKKMSRNCIPSKNSRFAQSLKNLGLKHCTKFEAVDKIMQNMTMSKAD
mmetsp:Transcript_4950/g.5831  ORF Transcript_4950/g.5831 Transcript_4950/m.5831 type:complete len:119 (+) Transcript_4950:1064-1420(+)|eukprot:CAMPEP_0168340204 /NCGR_PEP_ID=MMETSP0213-20121227/13922_1 /TAXON_ID=151035 /ORGANISM="Euplotes harpa, Strain FSP1.4" /LENGTH=118 /DNA_ID=CAMNT_0008346391 /DNA_START=907 /DNA_END=1263 /DNA_ORIENTATION=+